MAAVSPLRPRQSDPLDGARSELQALRASKDWDEATPVVHLSVHQAAAARRSTPPAPKPAPGWQSVVVVFQRFPPWGAVLVAVVAILAWAYLAVHGKAPIP